MMFLVWIFIPCSFVEPAYLIYRINKVCLPTVLKVPISSNFLFSYLILYIAQSTSVKEKCDLDKMQSYSKVLKTFKFAAILVHHSHQSSPGLE